MPNEPDDAGIPQHLKDGWEAYQEWWMARYRSGDPLPAGGCFVLNRRAVLMDELFRLHVEAAHGLGLCFDAVTVDLELDARGRPLPVVDVRLPAGWIPSCMPRELLDGGADAERLANEFVTGYLQTLYRDLSERVTRRVRGLRCRRPELQPMMAEGEHGGRDGQDGQKEGS